MAFLTTVQEYVTRARTIVQDTVAPYRYSDAEFIAALNEGYMEIYRMRPDLLRPYLKTGVPTFSVVGDTVDLDSRYRLALVYFVCGSVHITDEEPAQDARSAAFLNAFIKKMAVTVS